MSLSIGIDKIQQFGFEWPKYPLIEEYCVLEHDKVDLTDTLDKLRSSQAYYKKQLADAFNFKMQHSADYSDFTDKYDDYVRMDRQLGEAISYLEKIQQAVEKPAAG